MHQWQTVSGNCFLEFGHKRTLIYTLRNIFGLLISARARDVSGMYTWVQELDVWRTARPWYCKRRMAAAKKLQGVVKFGKFDKILWNLFDLLIKTGAGNTCVAKFDKNSPNWWTTNHQPITCFLQRCQTIIMEIAAGSGQEIRQQVSQYNSGRDCESCAHGSFSKKVKRPLPPHVMQKKKSKGVLMNL